MFINNCVVFIIFICRKSFIYIHSFSLRFYQLLYLFIYSDFNLLLHVHHEHLKGKYKEI